MRRLVYPAARRAAGGFALLAIIVGCDNMKTQPRYDPLMPSEFFPDGASARPLVPGVVVHGDARLDEHLYQGKINGQVADSFPFPMTRADLERGRERFDIYCSPCHGRLGNGAGMIVRRGFTPTPSYHIPRLREETVGHFFDVMTKGFGAMYSYNGRVAPEDRWRIAAYIRALQLSQDATLDSVPAAQRAELQGGLQ